MGVINILFAIIFTIICIQRLVELRIARENERYMKNRGAIEFGQSHYPFIVMLHGLFCLDFFYSYRLVESGLLNRLDISGIRRLLYCPIPLW